MAISERSRQTLFQRLDEQLGPQEAETMMELLPHEGWSDVARAGDIQQLERSVNDRITAESALHRAEIAELRADMAELRTELHADFATFRDELHRDQRTLQRQIILALVVALISVVVAASGLG